MNEKQILNELFHSFSVWIIRTQLYEQNIMSVIMELWCGKKLNCGPHCLLWNSIREIARLTNEMSQSLWFLVSFDETCIIQNPCCIFAWHCDWCETLYCRPGRKTPNCFTSFTWFISMDTIYFIVNKHDWLTFINMALLLSLAIDLVCVWERELWGAAYSLK